MKKKFFMIIVLILIFLGCGKEEEYKITTEVYKMSKTKNYLSDLVDKTYVRVESDAYYTTNPENNAMFYGFLVKIKDGSGSIFPAIYFNGYVGKKAKTIKYPSMLGTSSHIYAEYVGLDKPNNRYTIVENCKEYKDLEEYLKRLAKKTQLN